MPFRDVLRQIYFETLRRCDTERLTSSFIRRERDLRSSPASGPIIALGKCAVPLFEAVASVVQPTQGFIGLPAGYFIRPSEDSTIEIAVGTHPHLSAESFQAGDRLLRFARA